MSPVKFRRVSPRLWRGNGFGYAPATYAVLFNGREIGQMLSGGYGWTARFPADTVCPQTILRADHLADLKKRVIKAIECGDIAAALEG